MSSSAVRKRGPGGRRDMVVFDPEARRSYLRGFSERKKQRRAFGLAMQKVKDRESKLEERRETRKEREEQVKQAERQKEELLLQAQEDDEDQNDASEVDVPADTAAASAQHPTPMVTTLTKYEDEQTTNHWGGQVVVTTSVFPLDSDVEEDDDDDGERKQQPAAKHSVDRQQKYAGNVQKYLQKLKGKIPAKKKTIDRRPAGHKGKHGAAAMTGMGGAANLKLAKKALAKTQTKIKPTSASTGKKNKKPKRGK